MDVEAEEDVGLEALVHSAETAGQTKTEVRSIPVGVCTSDSCHLKIVLLCPRYLLLPHPNA